MKLKLIWTHPSYSSEYFSAVFLFTVLLVKCKFNIFKIFTSKFHNCTKMKISIFYE